MSRKSEEVYEGYEIFTVVLPVPEGRWSAISEIHKQGTDSNDMAQAFCGPCESDTSDAARIAVLIGTRQKIDDMLAEL